VCACLCDSSDSLRRRRCLEKCSSSRVRCRSCRSPMFADACTCRCSRLGHRWCRRFGLPLRTRTKTTSHDGLGRTHASSLRRTMLHAPSLCVDCVVHVEPVHLLRHCLGCRRRHHHRSRRQTQHSTRSVDLRRHVRLFTNIVGPHSIFVLFRCRSPRPGRRPTLVVVFLLGARGVLEIDLVFDANVDSVNRVGSCVSFSSRIERYRRGFLLLLLLSRLRCCCRLLLRVWHRPLVMPRRETHANQTPRRRQERR